VIKVIMETCKAIFVGDISFEKQWTH